MKKVEFHPIASVAAVWSAVFMFVLWFLARMGLYVSAAEQMSKWHMYFDLSFTGLIAGVVEAAIISYLLVASFVMIYNKMMKSKR